MGSAALLRPWRPSAPRRLLRWVVRAGWSIWRPWLKRRLARVHLEEVAGFPIVVLPGVHSPAVFRSGLVLAEAIRRELARLEGTAERRALDLGTGTGIGALISARAGWRVVAVDISSQAARCARLNAILNRLEDRIEVRVGDLFDPVRGERFDLITFNPPFYQGEASRDEEYSWRAPGIFSRFAAGLSEVLNPGGYALVVFSSDGDEEAFFDALIGAGLEVRPVSGRDFGNEIMTVYRIAPRWDR
ncbi:MAG: hypothetical protein KatS3mg081_0892 [Gemmatimonadales bacterium]|nr:MAG: hypothetical protein KatS3mg081_0892 [Gemmatimonadales bacterium]